MTFSNELIEPNRPFLSFFKKWRDLRGRSTRSEFWAALLITLVSQGAMGFLLSLDPMGTFNWTVYLLVLICIFWLNFAVDIRRARDAGFHPTILFLVFVPLIGPLALLVLLGATPSKNEQKVFLDEDTGKPSTL